MHSMQSWNCQSHSADGTKKLESVTFRRTLADDGGRFDLRFGAGRTESVALCDEIFSKGGVRWRQFHLN